MKPDIKRKILRKVNDIIAMSFSYVNIVEIVNINGNNETLPFARKITPDDEVTLKIKAELPPIKSGQKYIIALDMSGIGIVKFEGEKIQTIDPGHRYVTFESLPKNIEINVTSTSLFGSNMWNLNINRLILGIVDWEKFSVALKVESIIKMSVALEDEPKIMSFLNDLYRIEETPNVMQLSASDLIGHKNEGSYEELVDFYSVPVSDGNIEDLPYGYFSTKPLDNILSKSGINIKQNIYPVGHCHIDAAWLWPYSETRKKVERSFLNVAKLFDDGYNFIFAQSSALFYEWAKQRNSILFDKIKGFIKQGKWMLVGGMWVESDTNLLIGESLARQFLYGQSYFKEQFDSETKIGWLPDTFGFSGQLPQIMKQSGIESFITHKLRWNDTNVFPYTFFKWKGIDGTLMPTILVNSTYNGNMQLDEINKVLSNVKNLDDPYVYQFGYGDGGGGPNEEMTELLNFLPEVAKRTNQIFTQEDLLLDVKEKAGKAPEVPGELYVETHRGVYTTNYGIKRRVAMLEDRLIACDFVKSLLITHQINVDDNDLSEEWKTLLTAQFHDVLPGSANFYAYKEAFEDLDSAIAGTESFIKESMKVYCEKMNIPIGTMIINTSQYELKPHNDLKGNTIHISDKKQNTEDAKYLAASVKGFTVKTGRDLIKNEIKPEGKLEVRKEDGEIFIKGKYYTFKLNKKSELTLIQNGKEVIKNGTIKVFEDVPGRFDAWNIDLDTLNPGHSIKEKSKNIDYYTDGLNSVVSIKVEYEEGSKILQKFTMNPNTKYIKVENKIDLKSREKLVKFLMNSDVGNKKIKCEIPFGIIERDFSDKINEAKFEFPALRFVNWEDGTSGFSIIARELHGYSFVNDTLGISLLKTPLYPNPFSDRGTLEVSFYILAERTYEEVYKELNFIFHPPIFLELGSFADKEYEEQLLAVKENGVVIETIKKAEREQNILVRAYALENGGKIEISDKMKAAMVETDILEKQQRERSGYAVEFGKFELKNLLLHLKD